MTVPKECTLPIHNFATKVSLNTKFLQVIQSNFSFYWENEIVVSPLSYNIEKATNLTHRSISSLSY